MSLVLQNNAYLSPLVISLAACLNSPQVRPMIMRVIEPKAPPTSLVDGDWPRSEAINLDTGVNGPPACPCLRRGQGSVFSQLRVRGTERLPPPIG